jgi:integrase/recombinase XerD
MKMPPRRTVKKIKLQRRDATHKGPLGKAKVLTKEQFEEAEKKAKEGSLYGMRDSLFVTLSRRGALRANEIANIWLEDITDVKGNIVPEIHVSKRGAKYGKERTIDITEDLREALEHYVKEAGIDSGPIFWSYRGEPATSNLVQKQIKVTYDRCGFKGARSHSGRRYAITTLAQSANLDGASLRDVQVFAGHADLSTTATYIERSPHAKKMITRL